MTEPSPRHRVLVVEDEGVLSGYIEDVLEDASIEVVGVATTGAEALEMAERTEPDLALVDLALGGCVGGAETARLLREQFDIALVLVNGKDAEAAQAWAAGSTPSEILHRPFLPRHLLHALRSVAAKLRS
ncbi:response regulator [Belnapia moabensis]|uniref:response regulator n=1 Tax=Belnapia moabensis TaxID=365533 RepID=UPI0006933CC5|nr:response regulator [Belnapia moabensis]